MAYDESLAERVRAQLTSLPHLTEKKMFGGICWMYQGNMLLGAVRSDLMVRVDKGRYEALLAEPGARPMDFTGRTMVGMLFVGPEGWAEDAQLAHWVDEARTHAATLPPKAEKAAKRPTSEAAPKGRARSKKS